MGLKELFVYLGCVGFIIWLCVIFIVGLGFWAFL
jgi:hypothetical protein